MTEDRIAAAAEKLSVAVDDSFLPTAEETEEERRARFRIILGAFASECEEAGAYVECPGCKGSGLGGARPGRGLKVAPDYCSTCDGEGRIRRELAGALWALGTEDLADAARERWGKAKEEAT